MFDRLFTPREVQPEGWWVAAAGSDPRRRGCLDVPVGGSPRHVLATRGSTTMKRSRVRQA